MTNLLGEEPETFSGAPSLAACPRRLGDIGDDAAGLAESPAAEGGGAGAGRGCGRAWQIWLATTSSRV